MASISSIPQTLLSLVLIAVAWYMLWLGGSWWFMLMAIVAIVAFFEAVGLYRSKAMKKEWSLLGLLYWAIYIIIAFYGFWSLREEAFESAFRLFLIVTAGNIAIYFEGKFNIIKETHIIFAVTGRKIFFVIILAGAADFLYHGADSWLWFGSGAFIGIISQFGNTIVSLLKESARVKNSNILIPEKAGMLDRIGGYLIIGGIMAFKMAFGESDEGYYDY